MEGDTTENEPAQINLAVPTVTIAPKKGFFRRSPSPSPTQKRKEYLPISDELCSTSDTSKSLSVESGTGSATGKLKKNK